MKQIRGVFVILFLIGLIIYLNVRNKLTRNT